jgi:serine/threonine protein kinase
VYRVYLAEDKETGDKCALKIIRSEVLDGTDFDEIEREVDILRNLNHFNLTKLVDSGTAELRTKHKSKEVFYIAIELARGGELFDFIALTGQFKEKEARFFFRQLIDGLDYMHMNGYSHRDLKAENILLDKKFNIKIADFGYASRKSKNSTQVGTFDYMAPEVIRGDKYSGPVVDLFGAGLILFLMVTKNKPFLKAYPTDDYYKQLLSNRSDKFWAIHLRPFGDDFLSEEIKDLLLGLFENNPARRLSISEIKAHPWYQGEVQSHDKIKKEFKKRKALIKEHLKNAEEEKVEYNSDIFTTNVARGIGIEEDDEGFEETFREIQEYDPDFNRVTEFFSTR